MTRYKQATVDGNKIFYREAGPEKGPAILLLHGFPTSSHMFRNLIPALAALETHYREIGDAMLDFLAHKLTKQASTTS